MTISECAGFLRGHDEFLILTHIKPDGDTIGCAAALVRALRYLGKTAFVLENPEITPRYAPFVNGLTAPEGFIPGCTVAVDVASRGMLPGNAKAFAGSVNLAIDHHPPPKDYAETDLTIPEYAACGELVLDIIKELGVPLDEETASALYTAIATDTGCFSYNNTTENSLRAAADCAAAGAHILELNRELFRRKTRGRIAIEGFICSGMEYFFGGRIALVTLTQDILRQTGAAEDDLENIAAIPVSVEGVELGITIREVNSGRCKVSVRSSPAISSSEIAKAFGGGGHPAASGYTLDCGVHETRKRLFGVLFDTLK